MQYYTDREKLRGIGREQDLEKINRTALKIAREVADDTGTLMAGGVCNSNIFKINRDKDVEQRIRKMFEEQVPILYFINFTHGHFSAIMLL